MDLFLKSEAYKRREGPDALGWVGDPTWRLTGPIVGNFYQQSPPSSYAAHIPVRVWYSPEIIGWLCRGRSGEIPDGAAIIKELRLVNDNLGVKLDDEGCMSVGNDRPPVAWTVMVRARGHSTDGWYWPTSNLILPKGLPGLQVDPPVFDLSGITRPDFYRLGDPPLVPDPNWYPSGYWPTNRSKFPNVIEPQNGFTPFCIACHASAANQDTFASLDNVLGNSIRYRQFAPIPGQLDRLRSSVHVPPGAELPPPADEELEPPAERNTPFAIPLGEPSDAFLAFFHQLDAVSFSDTWPNRLPARTWDRVLPAAGGADSFVTQNMCFGCHDAFEYLASTGNMIFEDVDHEGESRAINLSPNGEVSASPMGLAGRDPIFYAQLQSETNRLPESDACIEDTCLHCHGVMGQRQLAEDTPGEADPRCGQFMGVAPPAGVPVGRPFRKRMIHQYPGSALGLEQKYGALARDGITCAVCHRIADEQLGEESTYTGNFLTDPPTRINGPYEHVVTAPMHNALGMKPQFGSQTRRSELCGTCHAVLLPYFDDDGNWLGFSYEQTTYLEWQNSDFSTGKTARTCQDCHMPTDYQGTPLSFEIANSESPQFPPTTFRLPDEDIKLTRRAHYARHSLHGLNLFLNQMVQQFPILLGVRQGSAFSIGGSQLPPLLLGAESMLDMARNQTADVSVLSFRRIPGGRLRAQVRVVNRTGHFLPSGVGFRRLFLEVLVRDRAGRVLWASGRTNSLGAILNGTTDEILESEQPVEYANAPFQPHYQRITSGDQVQIYQEVVEDSAGVPTTSFLHRVNRVKDNRIRPRGYDPGFFLRSDSRYIRELAETPGRAAQDPDYTDPQRTGADLIDYVISLDPRTRAKAYDVQVTLCSQSIPPFYLQQRFRDASTGAAEKSDIERLYYMASHLNVDAIPEGESVPPLADWKLLVGRAHRRLSP